MPGAVAYRVSAKHERNGVGSSFLHNQVHVGDLLDVSAPRGTFTLQPGEGPVVGNLRRCAGGRQNRAIRSLRLAGCSQGNTEMDCVLLANTGSTSTQILVAGAGLLIVVGIV